MGLLADGFYYNQDSVFKNMNGSRLKTIAEDEDISLGTTPLGEKFV